MLPFIQCHHTLGLAALVGVRKPLYWLSFELLLFVWENPATDNNAATEKTKIFFHNEKKFDVRKLNSKFWLFN